MGHEGRQKGRTGVFERGMEQEGEGNMYTMGGDAFSIPSVSVADFHLMNNETKKKSP